MKLSELRTFSRLSLPGAKKNRITNTQLDTIINVSANDVNIHLGLLPQDSKFNVKADQYKYDLSDSEETVERFTAIDNLGLYWNSGTAASPDWSRMETKTLKWLGNNFPQWRDAGSGDPQYYAKKGRYLYLYPTPDTALTDGFWLYFIEKAPTMSANGDYPFGNSVEIPEFSILSDVIIKRVEWWIAPMFTKGVSKANILAEYFAMIEEKRALLNKNLDITSSKNARMSLKKVC